MRNASRTLFPLVVLATTLHAQVPYIETMDVTVHGLDVIVTDKTGKAVTGLRKEDFELFENGKAREITNFSAFDGARQPAAPGTPGAASPPDEEVRPPRKFLFYVDEMSLVQHTMRTLRREIDQLITTTMQPGDEAMILRPAERDKIALNFTGDREAVRRELARTFESERWRGSTPIHWEQIQYEMRVRHAAGRLEHRRVRIEMAGLIRRRVQQRLGQLNSLVNAAAEIEGRKVLVLITESLPKEPGREYFWGSLEDWEPLGDDNAFGGPFASWDERSYTMSENWKVPEDSLSTGWSDLTPLVNEVARNAAANGVTIYAIHAEYGVGMLAPGLGIEVSSRNTGRLRTSAPPRGGGGSLFVQHLVENTEGSLKTLADMTGGSWVRGGASIDNLVRDIERDVESYYSLGYRAGDVVDEARSVEVRVKGHPELRVRARREVIRKSPEREMTDRVVASLLDPVETNELAIRLDAKRVGGAADGSYSTMHVEARVPLASLTFIPDGDKLKAKFTVHYAAMGSEADFVSGLGGTQEIEVPAAEFEAAKKTWFKYVVPMDLRRSRHTVAIGVLDAYSRLSGFERTELEVQ